MKQLIDPDGTHRLADLSASWPPALAGDVPALRRHLLPLRDFVACGCGTYNVQKGTPLALWRIRRNEPDRGRA